MTTSPYCQAKDGKCSCNRHGAMIRGCDKPLDPRVIREALENTRDR